MGTTYADIKLGSKDGGTLGTLRCRPEGMVWESQVRHASLALSLRRALHRPSVAAAWRVSCAAARPVQARDRKVELKKEDVDTESVEWCQLGSKYQLRVQQSNGSAMRFEGFDAGQHRELKEVWGKAVVLMRAWVLVLARGARARTVSALVAMLGAAKRRTLTPARSLHVPTLVVGGYRGSARDNKQS